ncbi:hypothetical protein CH252_27845 [Rhodococcus sp. 06-1477-1B]|nr:hypothetical protein CH252_27845 [Rhodococcus sp. 06-1477-1B]
MPLQVREVTCMSSQFARSQIDQFFDIRHVDHDRVLQPLFLLTERDQGVQLRHPDVPAGVFTVSHDEAYRLRVANQLSLNRASMLY